MTKLIVAAFATLALGTGAMMSADIDAAAATPPSSPATHCFTVPYYTVPVALCVDARFPWRLGTW